MKYTTLAELAAAYKSGQLSKDAPLIVDNDCSFVYADLGGTDRENVFDGPGPDELVWELLGMVGIPSEGA